MRVRVCLTKLAGLGASLASAAFAQTPAPPAPTVKAPIPASTVYVDRVMDGTTLPEDALELKASSYNASGWPRSLRVDYSVFTQTGSSQSPSQSNALAIGGFLDTPDHGSLSLTANLVERNTDAVGLAVKERSASGRIDQRALPLDGGWRAIHSAGDINTGMTPLARGLRRVSLTSTQIRGVAGQWSQGDAIDLNAATGVTGVLSGLDAAGFQSSGGQVTSAGGQIKLPFSNAAGRSDLGLQVIQGHNISDASSGLGGTGRQDTQAYWLASAWEGRAPWSERLAPGLTSAGERVGGLRVQGNLVRSASSRDSSATGVWGDANWRTDQWRNTAGLFRFEPKLRWGTSGLASDLQGAYWQADTASRQWQGGFSSEFTNSVSPAGSGTGAPGRSAYLSVNGRYRLDTRNSVGATMNVRALSSPGQAVGLTWDRVGDWGQNQLRSDFANTVNSRTTRLSVDQSWTVMLPNSFSSSLAWERVDGATSATTGLIWGLLGSMATWSQWSLDASVRGAQRSDGSRSINANTGLNWHSFGGWSLALRYTEARGQEPLPALVVSALTAATLPVLSTAQTNRSLQAILRYEVRAGTSVAPLGGLPGSGAGGLGGTVFYDADANGRREASEAGVPGVTVILDRRYVSRTDAQGHYEFPYVAAGEHQIEVSADNVPLPWSPLQRDPVATHVLVRQTTTFDFAVQRER